MQAQKTQALGNFALTCANRKYAARAAILKAIRSAKIGLPSSIQQKQRTVFLPVNCHIRTVVIVFVRQKAGGGGSSHEILSFMTSQKVRLVAKRMSGDLPVTAAVRGFHRADNGEKLKRCEVEIMSPNSVFVDTRSFSSDSTDKQERRSPQGAVLNEHHGRTGIGFRKYGSFTVVAEKAFRRK